MDGRLRQDLVLRLLDLGSIEDVPRFLTEALAVAVEQVGAQRGYIALFEPGAEVGDKPAWRTAVGLSDEALERVEDTISRSIIHDTLQVGRAQLIASAMGHPKYAARESVRINRITSVICVPVGRARAGVLYLQDRSAGGVFRAEDEGFCERFGRHLGPLVDRLLRGLTTDDPTAPFRAKGRFDGVAGQSQAVADALEKVLAFAGLDKPVMLAGPKGVGKRALAAGLHAASSRADGPFVHVAFDALPGPDHAHTVFGGDGALSRADGGVLFVSGLDAARPEVQDKLLGLLEAQDAGDGPDVRLVACVHGDPREAQSAGRLRTALHHRLAVLRVDLPGLDRRPEDIPPLLEDAGRRAAEQLGVRWVGVTPEAVEACQSWAWREHARELERRIQRAVAECDGTGPLDVTDLFPPAEVAAREPEDRGEGSGDDLVALIGPELIPWKDAKKRFARAYLEHALEAHDGNVAATARTLDLGRSRVFALINELGLREDA